jgi:predicted DNA-binding protein (MmcQ/YjbR family)
MNIEDLREYCLSKKGTEETFPFDAETLVFKVMGKAFLLCGINEVPVAFNVKCDPAIAIELRERHSCVSPGYHMNKKHWNTVTAEGSASLKLLHEWIDHSYDQVVKGLTKAQQKELHHL